MNRLDHPFRWHFVVGLGLTLGIGVGVLIFLLGLGFLCWNGTGGFWFWDF